MTAFTDVHPTLDNFWRAVILFGRNVASYKFALGRTLLEVAEQGKTFVPLAELAVPYARHLTAHLKGCDKQATSPSSRFLTECRKFNRGELTEAQLAEATAKLGFNNVIDAFHVVGGGEVGVRFFADERDTPAHGIRLGVRRRGAGCPGGLPPMQAFIPGRLGGGGRQSSTGGPPGVGYRPSSRRPLAAARRHRGRPIGRPWTTTPDKTVSVTA